MLYADTVNSFVLALFKYEARPIIPMDSETKLHAAMREVFRKKKSHKKTFAILFILILVVVSIALIATQSKLLLSGKSDQTVFKQEDVAVVSQSDIDFQAKVKNATGYDWTNFLNADGSEKAKTAALLFLSGEISALDDNYKFVNRSAGLGKGEIGLARLNASDTSKNNLLKLIGNVKHAEDVFLLKGLSSAKTRANRLSVIEGFFNKYSPPEGIIRADAQSLFYEKLGLTVDDYSRSISLMILNYNLFGAS